VKLCKVKIRKEFDGNRADYIYPDGYNAEKVIVLAYEDKPMNIGSNVSFCLVTVDDDFVFTSKMVEVDHDYARKFIDDRAAHEKIKELKDRFANRKRFIGE